MRRNHIKTHPTWRADTEISRVQDIRVVSARHERVCDTSTRAICFGIQDGLGTHRAVFTLEIIGAVFGLLENQIRGYSIPTDIHKIAMRVCDLVLLVPHHWDAYSEKCRHNLWVGAVFLMPPEHVGL